MFPEISSQAIIKQLIDVFDPKKEGTAIEIGVGTDNFYSVIYKEEGLKSVAVDPIAYEPFLNIAKEKGIIFEEACIYDKEGEVTLFCYEHSDFSSLNDDWFGSGEKKSKIVKSILLNTLLTKYTIYQITFLKIDVEGSEFEIIKQLESLNQSVLPQIIEFEYGGGGLKKSGSGGWDSKFFSKVIEIINILKRLGYEQGLILDSNETFPVFANLNRLEEPGELFKPYYEYGNFLAFRKTIDNVAPLENVLLKVHVTELNKQVQKLNIENAVLNAEIARSQYLSRLVKKAKRLLKKHS